MVETLLDVCIGAATALVCLVLIAESGLLVGVALPAGSSLLGLGVLAQAADAPLHMVVAGATTATVLGAVVGYRLAQRRPQPGTGTSLTTNLVTSRLPRRVRRAIATVSVPLTAAITRRPIRAAATAQFLVGARTVAPRLAGNAGVPLSTMLRGTIPAAILWSSAFVLSGAYAQSALPTITNSVTALAAVGLLGVGIWSTYRMGSRSRSHR